MYNKYIKTRRKEEKLMYNSFDLSLSPEDFVDDIDYWEFLEENTESSDFDG